VNIPAVTVVLPVWGARNGAEGGPRKAGLGGENMLLSPKTPSVDAGGAGNRLVGAGYGAGEADRE
jgi:hypothetical protein